MFVPDLFVYGTLMPHAASAYGRAERERLLAGARVIGAASVCGRLYDLGQYPGLVVSADPGDEAHGVVLRLSAPETVFPWLDAYEGIRRASPVDASPANEYERVLRPVRLAGGTLLSAWVYACLRPVAPSTLIHAGRWSAGA